MRGKRLLRSECVVLDAFRIIASCPAQMIGTLHVVTFSDSSERFRPRAVG